MENMPVQLQSNGKGRGMKKGQINQQPFETRFWLNVELRPDGECWPWKGYIGSRGYGYIKKNYRTLLAHRVSYELAFGVKPGEQQVCHKCDNPKCVNPFHLFLGTAKANAEDRNSKGREAHPAGAKHPMAKLTEQQVQDILVSQDSGRTLAKRYGVTPSTISTIKSGKSWGHVQSNYRAMGRVAA